MKGVRLIGHHETSGSVTNYHKQMNWIAREGLDAINRVQTTLTMQLALYVVLYSPIQMAADLPRNYDKHPDAFKFIQDVPTDWHESLALVGEVSEFVVFSRQERVKKTDRSRLVSGRDH